MTKQETQLNEIVRLKKHLAESELLTATRNLEDLDLRIEQKQARIESAQADRELASGAELSAAFNFVKQQLSDLDALSTQRPLLCAALDKARDKLRNIILSESVLNED